jgi:hypothetical protein
VSQDSAPAHPIRLVVTDGTLRRSRLTVFFRLLLVLPHLIWLMLWGLAVNFALFVLWLAILINGSVPSTLHDFVAGYLRYATHVAAYVFLAADPYPGFGGAPSYPVTVEVDAPARQSRWTALFRLVLAVPALVLTATLGGGMAWTGVNALVTFGVAFLYAGSGVAGTAALLAWFLALVRGRSSAGLRDLTAYAIGYAAQASGYLLLLTDRYPSSDPVLAEPYSALPEHPVRITVDDDLSQSRLTVFFRLLLALPHFIWLTLWALLVLLVALVAWLAALVTGRVPDGPQRFLAAFVRYAAHVTAFAYVLGRRFPGFAGQEGTYEIDVELDRSGRQSRWTTLFRLVLAVPALLVAGALGSVLFVVSILLWWCALVTGRVPVGLRNLGASCLRYTSQTYAYLLLVTARYPHAAPVLRERPPEPEPVLAPVVGDAF